MNRHGLRTLAILLLAFITVSVSVRAQDVTAAPSYTQAQLDQMLAPIALYPDPLLGQVLMASTYPLEVVEASRWLQNSGNAALRGNQLAAALEQQSWDPSVKALAPFPQVLRMMDSNLQWTEQLGDAFLAQQAAVTDSVQRLRQKAQTAGTLTSTPQQVVSTQGPEIIILPQNPEVVYVPAYNPQVVYGSWPYPDYQPYYFYQPGYNYGAALIGFGFGIVVAESLWGWDSWDWDHHRIDIDDRRFREINRGRAPISSGVWQHDPSHRLGVPYRDTATRARFQGAASPETRRLSRGFGAAAAPAVTAPLTVNRSAVPSVRPGKSPTSQDNRMSPSERRRQTTTGRPAATIPPAEAPATAARPAAPTGRVRPEAPAATVRPMAPAVSARQRPPAMVSPQRPAAPAFESFSRGPAARAQSARGAVSRSAPPAVSRSAPPAISVPRGGGATRGEGDKGDKGNDKRR